MTLSTIAIAIGLVMVVIIGLVDFLQDTVDAALSARRYAASKKRIANSPNTPTRK